jgi:hypothetical protein
MEVKWIKTLKIETYKIHSTQSLNQTKMGKVDSLKEQSKKPRKILKKVVRSVKQRMIYQREMILLSRYHRARTQAIFYCKTKNNLI